MLFFLFSLDGDLLHNIGMKDTVRGSNQRKVVGVVFPTCIISLLFRRSRKLPFLAIYISLLQLFLLATSCSVESLDSISFMAML